jgi:alpha-amylase
MSQRTICLYMHVHQPWRVKHYSVFDIGASHMYFNDESPEKDTNNQFVLKKVAEKSYLPTNQVLLDLLTRHEGFRLSLSFSGSVIEQMKAWAPEALESFKALVDTGKVEILAETSEHSLAWFFSKEEFTAQVELHSRLIEDTFGVKPTSFRNTELAYNNELARWADSQGYKAIITEGWEPVLDWRSPNFVYKPVETQNISLLMKNYKLSDDVAFRFSDKDWGEWPLTAEKYRSWLRAIPKDQPLLNLFMDYETFGEHQWADTGIFDFLREFVGQVCEGNERRFLTITEAAEQHEPAGEISIEYTITWADMDRDLSAWLGNALQTEANRFLYSLEREVKQFGDEDLLSDWRKLTASDHLYYMCIKWFNDGDVHAYFSPYDSPYEAYMNFMNAVHDLKYRLAQKGSP